MTTRVTISVPDEIAARAAATGNSSRYFADAVRAQLAREHDREWMVAHSLPVDEEGVRKAGTVRRRASQRMTPDGWAAAVQGPDAYAAHLADLATPAQGSAEDQAA